MLYITNLSNNIKISIVFIDQYKNLDSLYILTVKYNIVFININININNIHIKLFIFNFFFSKLLLFSIINLSRINIFLFRSNEFKYFLLNNPSNSINKSFDIELLIIFYLFFLFKTDNSLFALTLKIS